MKRRILDELRLTEISGVDKPCQEGARVAIMKRADDGMDANLSHIEYRIATINNTVQDLEKDWSDAARRAAALAQRTRRRVRHVPHVTRGAHTQVLYGQAGKLEMARSALDVILGIRPKPKKGS